MSILSGYGKFKRYVLTDSGYKLCSQWTNSNTVHFDDGNTAQTKVGAINGITNSLTATNSNIALSAAAGKNLQDQVTQLNTGLVWKQIDINDVITLIAPYATSFDPVWPSRAWQCGNLIQLDFRLDIAEPPVGNWFLKINDPYVPISPVYLLEQGGVAIMEDGHCGGWVNPGMYFVHTVYAINN